MLEAATIVNKIVTLYPETDNQDKSKPKPKNPQIETLRKN